jgi:transposase
MKPTTLSALSASERTAIFACDLSQDSVNLYTELGSRGMERDFPNRTKVIERELKRLKIVAHSAGFSKVLVVVEPTGAYHNALLQAAKRLGLETAWANPEAVSKMRVIETNDSGKTDDKDPRVICTLARIGKTLKHRMLQEPYSLLREWNKIYEAADTGVVEAKCAIHNQLKALFPDFSFSKDFLYSASGHALMKCYGCNPYRIVRAGKKRFARVMKKAAPRIKPNSVERLFKDAQSSVANALTERHNQLLELRLKQLWQDYLLDEKRKQQASQAIETLYEQARQDNPKLPQARKGVVTALNLGRIVAESGPWTDFNTFRQFIRFAGYNLRERKSGKYKGKTKISKKGRSLLRKISNQAVLPLVKKDRLYGTYYHRKKHIDKMPGTKAMSVVARRFLKMLWGWYRSEEDFEAKRVFICESQYRKAA